MFRLPKPKNVLKIIPEVCGVIYYLIIYNYIYDKHALLKAFIIMFMQSGSLLIYLIYLMNHQWIVRLQQMLDGHIRTRTRTWSCRIIVSGLCVCRVCRTTHCHISVFQIAQMIFYYHTLNFILAQDCLFCRKSPKLNENVEFIFPCFQFG